MFGTSIVYPQKMLEAYAKLAKGEELTGNDKVQLAVSLGSDPTDPLLIMRGKANAVQEQQPDINKPNMFRGAATKTQVSRNDFLNKMQMDTYSSIIYGTSSVDAFDDFVKKWKSSGGDQITKELNEW
ncbi:hypothetical protein [Paenibacillus sp. LPE1-1-1.1]|uniref:hypothetical protein n=1 Tax=Paenibacillus sp. LPE1-1-1.1 TaxID=3135230 RepID=UPI00343183AF